MASAASTTVPAPPVQNQHPDPGSSSAVTVPYRSRGQSDLQTFSPVNQNGHFAFDRVLKAGEVKKRTRKTKQWKSFYLVLRPSLLSVYKDSSESRLLKQISLSDLTAVAYLKDPKGRREHVFGVFSPSRNFHLQAKTQADAQEWVEMIRQEATIEEEEQDIVLQSPTAGTHETWPEHSDRLGSSSPEPSDLPAAPSTTTRDGIRIPGIGRPPAPSLEYSGDENGAYMSDLSDTTNVAGSEPPSSTFGSFIPRKHRQRTSQNLQPQPTSSTNVHQASPPVRSASYTSLPPESAGESSERTVWSGHLLALRTNRAGVRQWRRLWAVLRPKNLAFYKSAEEYAAVLILPLSSCIDAVEIDPISRSKKFCLEIITEEKSYRFSVESEDALAEWLGALKMQLSRRKEGRD